MVQSCTAAAANCPECYSKGVTPVHGGFECHSGAFPSARNALAALQSHYVSVWNFCNVAKPVTPVQEALATLQSLLAVVHEGFAALQELLRPTAPASCSSDSAH